jgi:hypothetical protein
MSDHTEFRCDRFGSFVIGVYLAPEIGDRLLAIGGKKLEWGRVMGRGNRAKLYK